MTRGVTASRFAATGAPARAPSSADYAPGVCNIGPAEIARRRRAGHAGVIATVVLLAVLVAVGAPPIVRLVLLVPAAAAAVGYLQASLRFCAGFGSRGVYNFGEVGRTTTVDDADARSRDRGRSLQIFAASLVIGLAVAILAVLLPI